MIYFIVILSSEYCSLEPRLWAWTNHDDNVLNDNIKYIIWLGVRKMTETTKLIDFILVC